MREVKFRAWDIDTSKMVNGSSKKMFVITACLESTLDKQAKKMNYNLMQYTGLKDKNGVEIYEGDIVNLKSTDGRNTNYKVEYERNCFVLKNEAMTDYTFGDDKYQHYKNTLEVIGNIYENPELLKES